MTDKKELILKWGTVKGWYGAFEGTPFRAALEKWSVISDQPVSAMMADNTEAHKDALCEAIDAVCDAGGTVYNDWDGRYLDRDEAKTYVRDYRK